MNNELNHGGPRKNAGQKPKYTEPTKTITFRVPKSKVEDVRVLVKKYLETLLMRR